MMKTMDWLAIPLLILTIAGVMSPSQSSGDDTLLVDSASSVLREFMAIPAKSIPQSLLADAKGIAILPRVVKGGFVVGAHHGRGVMLTRDEFSRWQPPMIVTFTGGGVGWQAGLQSTDMVLVFRSAGSVQRVMEKKLTIGVDAAAAAGPVGRQVNAATDATLTAEILSYSRSRGLFVGISIDGSALQVDAPATQILYRTNEGVPNLPIPAEYPVSKSVESLMTLVAQYSKTSEPMPAFDPRGGTVPPVTLSPMPFGAPSADDVRTKLAGSADRLFSLIDDGWRKYLALPKEVFVAGPPPSAEAIAATLKRYDAIAADPRYAALRQRAEFGATHELLREYYGLLAARPGTLNLPPPPPGSR